MPNQFNSPEGDLENHFITEPWLIDQYVGDTLWMWGSADWGALGNLRWGPAWNATTPVTTFAGGTNWSQVSLGGATVGAIKTDGTLWTWGFNSGSLGTNDMTDRCTPVTTFSGGTNWKQVANSGLVTHAIKTDGTLWVSGQAYQHTLGINRGDVGGNRCTPVTTFAGGTNWRMVSLNSEIAAAIKTDGTLWVWGGGFDGSLGNNKASIVCTPITTFAGGNDWKTVTCGYSLVMAIKTDGTLWCWGHNRYGKLANLRPGVHVSTPITTFAGGNNWKQISANMNHIAAIKTDGTLWTWGYNYEGQCGNNTTVGTICTPITTFAGGTIWKQVSVGYTATFAIKTDGTLWTWGYDDTGCMATLYPNTQFLTPVTTFAGGTNWKLVKGGGNITVAITSGTDPNFFIS